MTITRVAPAFASARRLRPLLLTVAVLTACEKQGLTDPTRAQPGTQVQSPTLIRDVSRTPPNEAAGLVFCDLAVRTPAGRYRVRTVPMKVPRELFVDANGTMGFGYRGWEPGSSDPRLLALCIIPNGRAAIAHFKSVFHVSDLAKLGARVAGPSRALVIPLPSNVLDPTVQVYDGTTSCDEVLLVDSGCSCGNSCPGWDEGGEWEGPQPVDEGTAEDWTLASPDGQSEEAALVGVITCSYRTDYPHASTHVFGMANVIGATTCSAPVSHSLTVYLDKQSCFWFFCWWSPKGAGWDAGFKPEARTNAAAGCSTGWWRGRSTHFVQPPFGYWPPWWTTYTSSPNVKLYC